MLPFKHHWVSLKVKYHGKINIACTCMRWYIDTSQIEGTLGPVCEKRAALSLGYALRAILRSCGSTLDKTSWPLSPSVTTYIRHAIKIKNNISSEFPTTS